MTKIKTISKNIGSYLFENKVMIAFALVCLGAILLSGSPMTFIVDGVITRIGRNTFTVLALIIPVIAGLGLNFGMVIGAIAAQIALFWSFIGALGDWWHDAVCIDCYPDCRILVFWLASSSTG